MVCLNHPGVTARRQCFSCKSPICPECQKKAFHHIFCSEKCTREFDQHSRTQGDLPDQLDLLDRSLSEDLREFSDLTAAQFKSEFSRLEDELDRALTALASMIGGTAAADASGLKNLEEALKISLDDFDRRFAKRTSDLHDSQENVRQVSLSAREFLLDLREKVEAVERKIDADVELLQKRLGRMDEEGKGAQERLALAQTRTLQGFGVEIEKNLQHLEKRAGESLAARTGPLSERVGSLASEIADQRKGLEKQIDLSTHNLASELSGLLENQRHATERAGEKGRSELLSTLKEVLKKLHEGDAGRTAADGEVRKSLQGLKARIDEISRQFQQSLTGELKRAVDDIAAVAVTQKAGWNDVVAALRAGAEKSVGDLRPDLATHLKSQIDGLVKGHGRLFEEAARELKAEAQKRMSRPDRSVSWQGRLAFGALGLAGGVLLMAPLYLSRESAPRGEGRAFTAAFEERMKSRDLDLRQWVGEQFSLFKKALPPPPEANPALVPFPAMTRGNVARREVAFTFDAGSNADVASEILDTLKARNLRATMFLTGDFIEKYPDVIRRVAAEGHEVGNHLLEHNSLIDPRTRATRYSKDNFLRQLTEVEKRYRNLTGKEMSKLWRAPYGDLNQQVIDWAASIGYRHVGWTRGNKRNLDTMDWVADPKDALYRSSDQIVANILGFEKQDPHGLNGAVVLMHLGTDRTRDFPHKRLPDLLDRLAADGYGVVPVTEVLRTDVAKGG